jgi:hypothetical protein
LGRNGILRLARASAALFVACVGLVGLSGAVSPAGATNPPGTIKVTVVGAPGSYAYGFCPSTANFLPWGNLSCSDGSPNYAAFTSPGSTVSVSVPAGDYKGVLATGPASSGPEGPLTVVAGSTIECTLSMTAAPSCTSGPPTGTVVVIVGEASGSYASGLCLDPTQPVLGSTMCNDGLSSANVVFGLGGGSTTTYSLAAGKYNSGLASLSPLAGGAFGPVYVAAGKTVTCTFTMAAAPACTYPDDGDGVAEPPAGFPASYDGNGDGTPDAVQANVTSLLGTDGVTPITIAGPSGTTLTGVSVSAPPGSPAPPAGATLPAGVLAFGVQLATGNTTADVVEYLPSGTNPNAYYKLRKGAWVDFTANTTIVGDTVTLHLVDNDSFDTDPTVGVIGDPGAPVVADKTGPVVTCPAPPTFLLHQSGTSLTANVSDAGAGVASPTVTVDAGTSSVGARTVDVTATDLAGNSTTQSCAYAVQYRFVGFGPPVANGALNTLKAGKSAPLTWWVGDAAYKPVPSASTFVAAPATTVACPALPNVPVLLPTSGSGLSSLGLGVYVYEWKSSAANVGQCQTVSVTLADGTVHALTFKLK